MNPDHPQSPAEEYLETAEKVRSGEYFREAREMYDLSVHDMMSERYFYIFVTALAVLSFIIAQVAMSSLYPLNNQIPLIVSSDDALEDIPRLRPLMVDRNDNPSDALLLFFTKNYVVAREEYSIDSFDRNVNMVKSQSSDAVVREFMQMIDPRNPDSPITQFQRHSKRRINVLSAKRVGDSVEVLFEAIIEGQNEVKRSHWRANIDFDYSGIALDEKKDKVKPVSFVVTKYRSKRLQQDIR